MARRRARRSRRTFGLGADAVPGVGPQPAQLQPPQLPSGPPPVGLMQKKILGVRWWIWASLLLAVGVAFWRRADIAEGFDMLKKLVWKNAHPSNFAEGRGGATIDTIVIHTTAGSFESAVNWFAMDHGTAPGGPYGPSSAHYTIGRDGRIMQQVSINNTAYHAGGPVINKRSIGIELEGWPNKSDNYTPAQMATLIALTNELLVQVPTIPRQRGVPGFVGHEELPEGKKVGKTDPGPYFQWAAYMNAIGSGGGSLPQV